MMADISPASVDQRPADLDGDPLLLPVSRWRQGQAPQPGGPEHPGPEGARPEDDGPPEDGHSRDEGSPEVCWVDLSVDSLAGRDAGDRERAAADLYARLAPLCGGQLEQRMLVDMLGCGHRPEDHRYRDGRVRLFVAFEIETREVTETDPESGARAVVKMAVYQPVGFLAGDGWIVTCWYRRRAYEGALRVSRPLEPRVHDDIYEAVARRWPGAPARTAGDLGVLILDELALTFAPAHRKVYDWLEAWELTLYLDTDPDDERDILDRTTLPDLWGTMTTLRYWLSPLNRAGMRADIAKAWFAGCTDHAAVNEVNDRIDRSLQSLRDLGMTLRASFGLLHIQLAEEQHKRSERLQNLIEYVTAAVLIPALVVGFYGANTRLPGQGTWWGFGVMLAGMVVLGTGSLLFLRFLRGRPDAAAAVAVNSRERARAGLIPELAAEDTELVS
jgi:hypothetical protein